jgi:long-chain acyl-CoA synthetase
VTFLENIFARLQRSANAPVIQEIYGTVIASATGSNFLEKVEEARRFLKARGLKSGDRCVLVAPNSIRWAAMDLAMMAEGMIVVPLYARQAPGELVGMMKDSIPARIFCADPVLASEIQKFWPTAPHITLLDSVFIGEKNPVTPPMSHADNDVLTIIYTSGTSGEPKGVMLNAENVNHMLGCTNARLDQLMGTRNNLDEASSVQAPTGTPDKIFHYLPVCFAGSWILLLTALSRSSVLTFSTDLSQISNEIKLTEPDYFLNVPTFLERVRSKIEETIQKRGEWASTIFARAKREYKEQQEGRSQMFDAVSLWLAKRMIFPAIRKGIGPDLKALICGSAPLSVETQYFFMMLGIPVLQVYGLTETTAICTMDDPHHAVAGRVGPAIPGIEMTISPEGEILVRGPNIFAGYWQRPEETQKTMEGGWFHTGDQGEVDATGNWRVTGRLKNVIILNSGHNVPPEPIEENLSAILPDAQQVMIVGNGRGYIVALVTVVSGNHAGGGPELGDDHREDERARLQWAIDAINETLPHYKQIRAFHIVPEPFSIENGLLTANGKLKRDVISQTYAAEITRLYESKLS